jgi:hypothetical protein
MSPIADGLTERISLREIPNKRNSLAPEEMLELGLCRVPRAKRVKVVSFAIERES